MKLRPTLICLLLAASAGAQNTTDPYTYRKANYSAQHHQDGGMPVRLYNLKGRIRKLTAFTYVATPKGKKGQPDPGSNTFTLVFDTSRQITEEWQYNDQLKVAFRHFYSDYRNRKEDSTQYYGQDGSVIRSEWQEYNAAGIIINQKSRWANGVVKDAGYRQRLSGDTLILDIPSGYGQETYVADKLVEYTGANAPAGTPGRNVTTEWFTYHPGGSLNSVTRTFKGPITGIREFNEAGYPLLIRSNEYTDTSQRSRTTRILTYDSAGNLLTERTIYESNGRQSEQVTDFTYREGRLISRKFRDSGHTVNFAYNEQGDPLFDHSISNEAVCAYTAYDAAGNWIRKLISEGNRPLFFVERHIEYYE